MKSGKAIERQVKIKVLVLSHSSDLAGAERSMLDLFDYWTKAKSIKPEFIIRKPLLGLAGELAKRNYKYYPLHYTNWAQRNPPKNPLELAWNAKENQKAILKIEQIIAKTKPAVVMTNTIVAPWAAIAANHQNLPHIWFVREYGGTDSGFKFALGRKKTFEDINALSELVVTNSQTLARYLGNFVAKSKITTLYTPFDLNLISQKSNQKTNFSFKYQDSLKLVIVGRIAPSKGQADAAQAVGILNSKGINTELCIVGEPSDKADGDSLRTAINKYNIGDKVYLVGQQQNPLAYAALADVCIMASGNEAFGRTTFEYMTLGKPVVGADSGATPELIKSGQNGYLYQLGQPADLAAALTHYANNRKLISAHGLSGQQKARSMMKGKFNADSLYEKVNFLSKKSQKRKTVKYLAAWLDKPVSIRDYMKQRGPAATIELALTKLKLWLKAAYIKFH